MVCIKFPFHGNRQPHLRCKGCFCLDVYKRQVTYRPVVYFGKEGGDLFQNIGKRRFGIADDEALKHDFLKAVLGAPGEVFQPVFFCQLPGYLTQGRKADAEYVLRSRKEGG